MTITSTGPSGFSLKPLVTVFAVAAIVAGVFAIVQGLGTDSQQSIPAPVEVSTEAVDSYTGPSGLTQALIDGKLIDGLAPAPGQAFAGTESVPEIIVVEGQGGLYDALIDGKLTMGQMSPNPGVQYVRGPEAATSTGGLSEAFADGKLDAGLIPAKSQAFAGSASVPEIVVIEGRGGLYDALIDGKLTMGYAGVRYVTGPETASSVGGLLAALDAGKFDEGLGDGSIARLSPSAGDMPTVWGGHQE